MLAFQVVMVEPGFDDSVGSMARVMKNFGLEDLRLVNPIARIGRRARMRAGHAQDVLEAVQTFKSLEAALEDSDLSAGTTAQRSRALYRVRRRPVTPREFAANVAGTQGRIALVFGREGTGLKNGELELCDTTLTIPSSPAYPTLNITHAAATMFYELYVSAEDIHVDVLALKDVKNAILGLANIAASRAGVKQLDRQLATRALKNIMGRSAIRAREASLLAGMFRKIILVLPSSGHERSRFGPKQGNCLVRSLPPEEPSFPCLQ